MSGLEIAALVCGVIGAIKAFPEIPGAWRRITGRGRRTNTQMAAAQSNGTIGNTQDHSHVYQTFQSYDTNRTTSHRSNNKLLETYDVNRTIIHRSNNNLLEKFDVNRTAIHHSNNTVLLRLDDNRTALHHSNNELLRDVLVTMQEERKMLFDRIRLDQSIILFLVAILMYLIGKYSTEIKYLKYLNFTQYIPSTEIDTETTSSTLDSTFPSSRSLLAFLNLPFLWIGKVLSTIFGACTGATSSVASWSLQNAQYTANSIINLPFPWIGKMVLLALGVGVWVLGFASTILVIHEITILRCPKGKMPVWILLAGLASAASGGAVMHFLEFSQSICSGVALVPAFVWNGLAIGCGVTLKME